MGAASTSCTASDSSCRTCGQRGGEGYPSVSQSSTGARRTGWAYSGTSFRAAAGSRLRLAVTAALAAARGRLAVKGEALARFAFDTRALYESADLLLPNSTLEAEQIRRDLGTTTPHRVVPNAADPETFLSTVPWEKRRGVVYAGRLEPHKNQLELVRALEGTGVSLTLVGADHPDHPRYCAAVREARGPDVVILPKQDHQELAVILSEARVHAMPSRFESTGSRALKPRWPAATSSRRTPDTRTSTFGT